MANEYLTRTPTSTGNRRVWTLAGWVKLQKSNFDGYLFHAYSSDTNRTPIALNGARFQYRNLYGSTDSIETKSLYRDCGNWMHFIVSTDTTQANDPVERVKIYINGKLLSEDFNTDPNTSRNSDTFVNAAGIVQRVFDSISTELKAEIFDWFLVDGQALTPDVFGFYKQGNGYISAGSTQSTDFRPGQWVPKTPRVIKTEINRRGGFGVNGFYLPMNDSSNFGADFHTTPNSIITLKGEDLPQPRNGAPTTTDAYVSQLRTDPYAANLVLALPFVNGGLENGLGDYSHIIRNTGTAKTFVWNAGSTTVSTASSASYYGSAGNFPGGTVGISTSTDFKMDGSFTVESWFYSTNFNSTSGNHISQGRNGTTGEDNWVLSQGGSGTGSVRFLLRNDNGTNAADLNVANSGIVVNQWHHFAGVYDDIKKTSTVYLNGVVVGINTNVNWTRNNTSTLLIGSNDAIPTGVSGNRNVNGYLQDLRIYKGVAKYKGGFDVPKPYTPVGIATWRQVPDTTANNFATLNPLGSGILNRTGGTTPSATYSNGNQTVVLTQDSSSARSTIGVSTGKWYWEVRYDVNSNSPGNGIVGLTSAGTSYDDVAGVSYEPRSDRFRKGGVTFYDGSNDKTSNGLIVGVALDKNVGIISFFADGVNQANGTMIGINTLSDYHLPECFTYNDGASNTFSWNFGQNPTFSGNTTAGTFTDTNGKGLFKYQPPSGFLALCEDNLPTPAISDPGKYFKTVLWTGDGNSGRSIVGVGFTPDLVWIKERSVAQDHILHDSVRGAGYYILSNSTQAETFNSAQISSFNNDGFTVGSSIASNQSSQTFVAWCWRAGAGTTTANTAGSIPSVVSVNQDAGFSIATYTGTGSALTFGHGLGKVPAFAIFKYRSGPSGGWAWVVYHKSLPTNYYVYLQSTVAQQNLTGVFTTAPTSTLFSLGTEGAVNTNNNNMVCYSWTEIEGFSKFGSYVGNGNADGPAVYCGFKPAFILLKKSSTTGNWNLFDSSRNSTNPVSSSLFANLSDIENTTSSYNADFLSNGFKVRTSDGSWNDNGVTYIFAAWAESPFTTANAK